MTPLADAARLLYGPRWQSELARAYGAHIRTVQRWASGRCRPPDDLRDWLRARLTERQREIEAALAALERS